MNSTTARAQEGGSQQGAESLTDIAEDWAIEFDRTREDAPALTKPTRPKASLIAAGQLLSLQALAARCSEQLAVSKTAALSAAAELAVSSRTNALAVLAALRSTTSFTGICEETLLIERTLALATRSSQSSRI